MKKSSKTEKHADRAHAVLSASSAERWLNCTPSAMMCDKIPNVSSSYAEEGTLAHEIAEYAILYMAKKISKKDYSEVIQAYKENEHWYEGIVEDLEPYVMHVVEQINLPGAVWEQEKKTDLTAFIPNGFGTTDAAVIAEGVLYITDLKFGRGVRVNAVDNSQLKLYAAGVLIEYDTIYDIHTIRLAISQPRIGALSFWDITPAELLKWAEEFVKPTAQIAARGEGQHKTGDWCKFCRAKIHCPAIKAEATMMAEQDFSELASLSPEDSEETLIQLYRMADRVEDFLDAIKAHVYQQALGGKKWPGLKLVEGKSNRKIVDEKAAVEALLDAEYDATEFTNTKIKGIGDLETLLGKEQFGILLGPYVEKPKGKATLVDESDKRPEISSANDFD